MPQKEKKSTIPSLFNLIQCVFRFEDENCDYCVQTNRVCSPKVTRHEYRDIMNKGLHPSISFSAIVLDVERENPNKSPHEISQIASDRLRMITETRRRAESGGCLFISNSLQHSVSAQVSYEEKAVKENIRKDRKRKHFDNQFDC